MHRCVRVQKISGLIPKTIKLSGNKLTASKRHGSAGKQNKAQAGLKDSSGGDKIRNVQSKDKRPKLTSRHGDRNTEPATSSLRTQVTVAQRALNVLQVSHHFLG